MTSEPVVFVVDDDAAVRDSLTMLLRAAGYRVEAFHSAKCFLDARQVAREGCLIVDIRMPDMGGLELQQELIRRRSALPVIVITGHGDVPLAVQAMKAGAIDFLEKPFIRDVLLAAVRRSLDASSEKADSDIACQEIGMRLASLTAREREVYEGVVAGKQSKIIAFELGTSPRTIEIHRGRMMHKMRAGSLQDLVRIALAAKDAPRR